MPRARAASQLVAFGNKMYSLGEANSIHRQYKRQVFVYDPSTDKWSMGHHLIKERGFYAAVLI